MVVFDILATSFSILIASALTNSVMLGITDRFDLLNKRSVRQ